MTPWLAVALWGCEGPDTKPDPEPGSPEPTAVTGDTGQPAPLDADGDTFPDDEDCAPLDPLAYPGAVERCNGLDDDCDGQLHPVLEADDDADGALWCEDCNDVRSDVYPGAPDAPGDLLDANCDGTDGEGTALANPLLVGQNLRRTAGLSLAGGDVDGDGCAELLIGEPGGYANYDDEQDAATLGIDCWPWQNSLLSYPGFEDYLGYYVDLAPGLVVVHEAGWEGGQGRLLVFDETFGPEAEPILEVVGAGAPTARRVDSVAILGEPAQWLLIGRQASLDRNSHFQLIDAARRGNVNLGDEGSELILQTDSEDYTVGLYPGDVGDRDGDGEVDLGVVAEMGERPARFFPQVTGGHTDDAPEIWSDPNPGWLADQLMRSGGDLDGDGRSDAVLSSIFADGQQYSTGRAFLLPWLGSGEFNVEVDAPTRLDGELTYDWFGLDSEVTDLDADGQPDLVISAPGAWSLVDRPGKVLVFRGPLPQGVLTTADADALWVGEQWGDHAGAALGVGDFDGSGRGDIAIGAPFADRDDLIDAGAVYVLIDPL